MKRRVTAPFVLIDKDTNCIAGFYTLSMKSVLLVGLPPKTQKKLPRYPEVPVALIGRLGVDNQYSGKGLGGVLLVDALKRAYEASSEVAAFAVVVDAKHGAEKFYEKYGFIPFPDNNSRLFLPMRSIEELF